ncbi:MAG: type II toxin-antitoxin system RelB/DinJ family antitoxin [Fibromonadales bacterium]|nr:type II toxin-antitoxin system RelB/DinJ family antitoxin [Fibromonadales bacterium]
MPSKVLVQARIDRDVKEKAEAILEYYGLDIPTLFRMSLYATINSGAIPLALSQKEIKECSTENGNWLFDEQERKFVKKEIVKELEENQEDYMVKNNKESMQSFLKRAMKAG